MIAKKVFVIEAPQQRVWQLLGSVIFRCLPLEQMNAIDQSAYSGILRWKLGFARLPLNLEGKLVEISPPDSLGSIISVKRGMIRLSLRVIFTLRSLKRGQTEMVCSAAEEGRASILGWLLRGRQRRFAEDMFDSVTTRLQRLC